MSDGEPWDGRFQEKKKGAFVALREREVEDPSEKIRGENPRMAVAHPTEENVMAMDEWQAFLSRANVPMELDVTRCT